MTEIEEHKRAEAVEHNGARYVRINPDDVNLESMTPVEKAAEVAAAQVIKGSVKVITRHGDEIETINYASKGDWVVYNIGASAFKKMFQKLLYCEKKSITKDNFSFLYKRVEGEPDLYPDDQLKVMQELMLDNTENPKFYDASFLKDLRFYRYIGKQLLAAVVPYNFVIRAPWGADQFMKRGGLIIYDPNIDLPGKGRMYGIEGARYRIPGEFEKTFSVAGGGNKVIADTFKEAIKADRSPIAGIQYNNIDLAEAYERAGKRIPKFLQKFLDN